MHGERCKEGERLGSLVLRPAHRLAVIAAAFTLALSPSAHAAGTGAWGWGQNDKGQLGLGASSTPVTTPTAISGVTNAVAIAGGNSHSLALRADGTVMAWGANDVGQLGNGTLNPSPTPVQVPGLSHVVAIAAGFEGDASYALLSNGTVRAWGDGGDGQLGIGAVPSGTCRCEATPVTISGLSGVVAIAGLDSGGMALLADGTARSWGANESGELGDGTISTTGCACKPAPVRVKGLANAVGIAGGTYNELALRADGRAMAWGWDDEGQLGNGSADSAVKASTPGLVDGLTNAVAITAGYEYGAVLLAAGRAAAWGYALNGQLGDGTVGQSPCGCVPSPVAVSNLSDATTVVGGGYHALAIRANRTAMSWGYNRSGELGNGSVSSAGCFCVTTPAPVKNLSNVSAIDGGAYHSLALTGPSQRLRVGLAGAGSGRVGGSEILCPLRCARTLPRGGFAFLRVAPSPGTRFAGFTGACRGLGPCRIQLSVDRSVVATFGVPKGTRITSTKINQPQRSAAFRFTVPGAVTGYQCKLIRPPGKHGKKPKSRFSKCSAPKRYEQLKPGKYTFKVRARNIRGIERTPAKKTFKINQQR